MHCRLFGTYVLLRLNNEARALGPPFSAFRYPFPPVALLTAPDLPRNNPQAENTAMLLVDSLELTSVVQAFESLAHQDLERLNQNQTSIPAAAPLDPGESMEQLKSLRRHQAFVSIFTSLVEFLCSLQNRRTNTGALPNGLEILANGIWTPQSLVPSSLAAVPPRPQAPVGSVPQVPGVNAFQMSFQTGWTHQQQPQHQQQQQRPHGQAEGEGLQHPLAQLAAAGLQQNYTALAVTAQPAPMERVFSFHLDLGELRRTLIPFLWLSAKLSFFLWIFGRHAAPDKRIALCVLALICVLWETWAFRARRAVELRRQTQQAFNRERAVANQEIQAANQHRPPHRQIPEVGPLPDAAVQPAPLIDFQMVDRHPRANGPPAAPVQEPNQALRFRQNRPAGPGVAAAAAPGPQLVPFVPQPAPSTARRRSPWTASYWISKTAGVSLAAEAKETGLRALLFRRDNCGLTASGLERYTTVRDEARWIRRLRTGIVLFFGTLIPEVERKRRRALEKRERVLRELKAECEKQEAELAEALIKWREETGKQSVLDDNSPSEEEEDESGGSDETSDPTAPTGNAAQAGDIRTARVVNSLLDENSRAPTPDIQAPREPGPGEPPAGPAAAPAPFAAEVPQGVQPGDEREPQMEQLEAVAAPLAARGHEPDETDRQAQGIPQAQHQLQGPGPVEEIPIVAAAPLPQDAVQQVANGDAAAIVEDDEDEDREGDNDVNM